MSIDDVAIHIVMIELNAGIFFFSEYADLQESAFDTQETVLRSHIARFPPLCMEVADRAGSEFQQACFTIFGEVLPMPVAADDK